MVLYHFTARHKLLSILKNDAFYLTPNFNLDADTIKGKYYHYMSFSRNKSILTGYGRSLSNGMTFARLKINSDITNNNKIIPFDFWNQKSEKPYKDSKGRYYNQNIENEDRLISKSNVIKNASKYIDLIEIYVDEHDVAHLDQINNIANKRNIPIKYYTDSEDFEYGRNAKTFKDIFPTFDNDDKDSINTYDYEQTLKLYYYTILAVDNIGLLMKVDDDIYNIVSKMFKGELNDSEIMKVYDNIKIMSHGTYNIKEIVTYISNVISNIKRKPDDESLNYINSIGRILRKAKIKTLYDYLVYKLYGNLPIKRMKTKNLELHHIDIPKYEIHINGKKSTEEELDDDAMLYLRYNYYPNDNDLRTIETTYNNYYTLERVIEELVKKFTIEKINYIFKDIELVIS